VFEQDEAQATVHLASAAAQPAVEPSVKTEGPRAS
jgi:hypothetical protein